MKLFRKLQGDITFSHRWQKIKFHCDVIIFTLAIEELKNDDVTGWSGPLIKTSSY